MDKETSDKHQFSEIFSRAIESLTPQQLRVYNLHLLGWMNQEIAEELQIRAGQASIALYQGRRKVKDFLKKQDYSLGIIHQEILALQKRDLDLLSKILISKRTVSTREEISEQDTELSAVLIRVGHLKDACIKAETMSKNILRIAELLGSTLPKKYKEELLEQIEEYQAAQEGLEKSLPTDIDFDALWEKALTRASERSVSDETGILTDSADTLPFAAEDSSREEQIKSRLMHEFTNKAVLFRDYTGRLRYRNVNSAFLVLKKGDTRARELDGRVIDLVVGGQLKKTLEIEYGSVVINFGELGLSIEDYAKIKYVIRRGEHIVDEGGLGDG